MKPLRATFVQNRPCYIRKMSTFSSYLEARNSLEKKCVALEDAWRLANDLTEFEEMSGSPNHDESEVVSHIEQARLRLKSDTIEVGIFGEVKRGKSTLINALVGRRVSSMRVTPETAIPVWVENGSQRTVAVYNDGTSREVEDTHEAQELATQRSEKKSKDKKKVVRVVQYTELSWLPEGLRIVDTPGLQDPSLVDSYEQRTMEELERVSAAVFMFVSPPGPAGHEVQLLQQLARHGVDKVFLVCNFYPDVWADRDDRDSVIEYVRRVVVQSALKKSKLAPKDVRLYAINARDALQAIEAGDIAAYRTSGVDQLRMDLEEFLTDGALQHVTAGAKERIAIAKTLILATLKFREKILGNPVALQKAVRDLERAESESSRRLDDIEIRIGRLGEDLGVELGELLCAPYLDALQLVASAGSRAEMNTVLSRLDNLLAAAQTRAATEFDRRTSQAVASFERELLTSFGSAASFAGAFSVGTLKEIQARPHHVGSVTQRIDWSGVAARGVVQGVGSAAVGGALAGGAGIALLATGPIGWIVGAATMGLMGLVAGSVSGAVKGASAVKAQDRQKLVAELTGLMSDARKFGHSQGIVWATSLSSSLRSQRGRYLGDKSHEIEHIQRVLGDERARNNALAKIQNARELLANV